MVEHSTHKAGVVGPIPTPATKIYIWAVSVARLNASPCHGEDHGFESRTARSEQSERRGVSTACGGAPG